MQCNSASVIMSIIINMELAQGAHSRNNYISMGSRRDLEDVQSTPTIRIRAEGMSTHEKYPLGAT